MTRHYSTRDFFRQMPNRLLARYFEARGVLAELAALPEEKRMARPTGCPRGRCWKVSEGILHGWNAMGLS